MAFSEVSGGNENIITGWDAGNFVFREKVPGNGASVQFGYASYGMDLTLFGAGADDYWMWDESSSKVLHYRYTAEASPGRTHYIYARGSAMTAGNNLQAMQINSRATTTTTIAGGTDALEAKAGLASDSDTGTMASARGVIGDVDAKKGVLTSAQAVMGILNISAGGTITTGAGVTAYMNNSGTLTTGYAFKVDAVAGYGWTYGLYMGNTLATTGIYIGNTTTAINIAGTATTGISLGGVTTTGVSITGNATTAISVLTGTFGTGLSIAGTTTTGIAIAACTTGLSITGATTTAISLSGDAVTGISITSGMSATNVISIAATAGTAGINISGNCTTGITMAAQTTAGLAITGATVTGISIAGATTTGVSITGSATTAISILTGTYTTGISVAGTTTTAIAIAACTTGLSITGATTTAISISGDAGTAIDIPNTVSATTNVISIAATSGTNGINISGDCQTAITIGAQTTAGLTITGATATGISVAGATTTAISVTGSATTALSILTGTFGTGISVAGTLTTGVTVAACVNAFVVSAACTGTDGWALRVGTSGVPLATTVAASAVAVYNTQSATTGTQRLAVFDQVLTGAITTLSTTAFRAHTQLSANAITGAAYVYGGQHKFSLGAGTINHADSRVCASLVQMDISTGTYTAGQLSALWVDAGAASAMVNNGGQFNMVRITNTTACVPNAVIYIYSKATYLFDIGGDSPDFIVAGAGTYSTADGYLAVQIGEVAMRIPYFAAVDGA